MKNNNKKSTQQKLSQIIIFFNSVTYKSFDLLNTHIQFRSYFRIFHHCNLTDRLHLVWNHHLQSSRPG